MNPKQVLKKLRTTVFDQQYTEAIRSAYETDFEVDHSLEADYATAEELLREQLTAEQKELLEVAEQSCNDSWSYASQHPFSCGMLHAFEQYFCPTGPYRFNYEKVIAKGMCTMPGMELHHAYYSSTTKSNDSFEALENDVSEDLSDHITSVACVWEQRIHSATIHSFYLGYQAGLSIINEVVPNGTHRMIGQLLLLEYELGLTLPFCQREALKERCSKQ